MKKLLLTNALILTLATSYAQSTLDLAKEAQCTAAQATLDPIIKSSEHPKRGIKAATWVRLGDAYADYTTNCGKDSTSAVKAYNAYLKAVELDAAEGGKEADAIKAKLTGEVLYSAVMNQGVAHYNSGNMILAEELFTLGMKVDVKDTLSSFYSGIVAQQNGHEDVAKNAFKAYLNNGGKDPAVFYSLSSMSKKAEDYDTAIAILKEGILANPSDKDLRGELINIYLASNKIKEAIADLEKLLEADPNNSLNLLNLGILYESEGDLVTAHEYYIKTLAADPNNYEGNFNMGVFFFNKAVQTKKEVDAMDIKTYQKEGKAIEVKVCEQFQLSKPYFEKCKSLKPDDSEVVNNLATLDKVLAQCSN